MNKGLFVKMHCLSNCKKLFYQENQGILEDYPRIITRSIKSKVLDIVFLSFEVDFGLKTYFK